MRLTIISHTPHYFDSSGEILGWGPTVREINYLSEYFLEIVHLAPLHNEKAPNSSIPYNINVKFVHLKPSGGKSFYSKLQIIDAVIYNSKIIWE